MQLNQQDKCIVKESHTVAAQTSSDLEQIEAWWVEDLVRQQRKFVRARPKVTVLPSFVIEI